MFPLDARSRLAPLPPLLLATLSHCAATACSPAGRKRPLPPCPFNASPVPLLERACFSMGLSLHSIPCCNQ